MTFFINIVDVIGFGIFLLVAVPVILCLSFYSARECWKQRHCKHEDGVNETQACDAICRKCGKNLGFIGKLPNRGAKVKL